MTFVTERTLRIVRAHYLATIWVKDIEHVNTNDIRP
jgi:hypothetical protein